MTQTTTVDMSPDAIDLRLRQLAGLHRLQLSLRHAQLIDPVATGDTDGREPPLPSPTHPKAAGPSTS